MDGGGKSIHGGNMADEAAGFERAKLNAEATPPAPVGAHLEAVLASLPYRTNDELRGLLDEAKAILTHPVDLTVPRDALLEMVGEATAMIKAVHMQLQVRQAIGHFRIAQASGEMVH